MSAVWLRVGFAALMRRSSWEVLGEIVEDGWKLGERLYAGIPRFRAHGVGSEGCCACEALVLSLSQPLAAAIWSVLWKHRESERRGRRGRVANGATRPCKFAG